MYFQGFVPLRTDAIYFVISFSIQVSLTKIQKQFYRAIYERNTQFLYRGSKPSNGPSLMNVMMELRKCCNHPYLIKGVEERSTSEIPVELREDHAAHLNKTIDCCGKLVLLDKLLPRLYSEGHKVLIFSQMVRVLNILEEFLKFRNYNFERLDGNSRAADRHTAVERFRKASTNTFVMILSTKAGGLGLNLTAADTVIIYDSDWNPHNDLQVNNICFPTFKYCESISLLFIFPLGPSSGASNRTNESRCGLSAAYEENV